MHIQTTLNVTPFIRISMRNAIMHCTCIGVAMDLGMQVVSLACHIQIVKPSQASVKFTNNSSLVRASYVYIVEGEMLVDQAIIPETKQW